jgi:outer membrane lipopolysaccharide assembly protein LptE/RlpB
LSYITFVIRFLQAFRTSTAILIVGACKWKFRYNNELSTAVSWSSLLGS